jgi:hypothetical protein
MMTNLPRGVRTVSAIVALGCAFFGPALAGRGQNPAARDGEQAQPGASAQEGRKKELDAMRQRAGATKVRLLDGGQKTVAQPLPEALVRYSDQPRNILDATVWGYGTKGRPSCIQKVECYRLPGSPKYFYCMASLSDGLVSATWRNGRTWSANKPGIQMLPLPDGPKAASTQSGRLLQIKSAIRQFSATFSDPAGGVREEIRLLPRPIYRYADPGAGLQDGAIFAFATNGTNPDLLILIELHGPDLARATWKYGPARMTLGQLTVRLDNRDVWSVPYYPPPWGNNAAKFDTWLCFFDTQGEAGN